MGYSKSIPYNICYAYYIVCYGYSYYIVPPITLGYDYCGLIKH